MQADILPLAKARLPLPCRNCEFTERPPCARSCHSSTWSHLTKSLLARPHDITLHSNEMAGPTANHRPSICSREHIEGYAPLTSKSSYGGHDNPAVRRTLASSKRRSATSGVGQRASSAALEQEPGAALRLVDPGLDQARTGDVAIFVAQPVGLPHTGSKLQIVTELSQHVERGAVVGIIV
jgi:hypothetical protein